jgi:hypothetical protein
VLRDLKTNVNEDQMRHDFEAEIDRLLLTKVVDDLPQIVEPNHTPKFYGDFGDGFWGYV